MATTALIVEIIVIGMFSLVWLTLLLFRIYSLDAVALLGLLSQYKDWSTIFLLVLLVVSYQFGWSMNLLSYFIAKNTFNKKIILKVLKNLAPDYRAIQVIVFMNGSTFVLEKLREELSVIRLTRSAFVNFLLIGIALFINGIWIWGVLSLVISSIFLLQAYDIYTRYCERIFNTYRIIEETKQPLQGKNPQVQGDPPNAPIN